MHRLLYSHMRFMIAINVAARKTLINDTGVVPNGFSLGLRSGELMSDAYQGWQLKNYALPNELRLRGVADKISLPYYPYRDDGLLVWEAIGEYVQKYIDIYYLDD